MSTQNLKRISVVIVILILLLSSSLVIPVLAGETRSGKDIIVGADEVIPDDLYCFGETIIIDGTVQGDLIAAGNEVRVNGNITGDLIAAAKTVVINGEVGDDARIAGFELQITEIGQIGDDVNAASFSLTVRPSSQVGGDMYVMARQVELGGELNGNLIGGMDALRITGVIDGDVNVQVGAPETGDVELGPLTNLFPVTILPSGLQIADTAVINGQLVYTSRGMGDISPGAQIKEQVYQTPAPSVTPEREAPDVTEVEEISAGPSIVLGFVLWILEILRRFISLLVIALVLAWLWPFFPKAARKLKEKPWPSLGWGCLVEIVFFIAMPILFILIIVVGLLLGLLTLGGLQGYFISAALLIQGMIGVTFGFITSYVSKIVVAYLVGSWLLEKGNYRKPDSLIWPTLIGIILFVIVRSIPILGGIVSLVVILFGMGAIWLWIREYLWPPKELLPMKRDDPDVTRLSPETAPPVETSGEETTPEGKAPGEPSPLGEDMREVHSGAWGDEVLSEEAIEASTEEILSESEESAPEGETPSEPSPLGEDMREVHSGAWGDEVLSEEAIKASTEEILSEETEEEKRDKDTGENS